MKTFKELFINESSVWLNPDMEVVFMSKDKYNGKIAKVLSDDDKLHVTIQFEDGKKLTAVKKTDLRMVGKK